MSEQGGDLKKKIGLKSNETPHKKKDIIQIKCREMESVALESKDSPLGILKSPDFLMH